MSIEKTHRLKIFFRSEASRQKRNLAQSLAYRTHSLRAGGLSLIDTKRTRTLRINKRSYRKIL